MILFAGQNCPLTAFEVLMTYGNFQKTFSTVCTEKSLLWPALMTCCIFSGILGTISSATRFILFRLSHDTIQLWQDILHWAVLYVAVTSFALSMSARKTEIYAANISCHSQTPKYNPSDLFNKGPSIILKH